MAISDFKAARKTIQFPGGEFEVRGLTVTDLGTLVRMHLGDMEDVRELVLERLGNDPDKLTAKSAADLGLELVQRIPTVAGTIIAIAADDLSSAETVITMPFWVQFSALSAIAEATFKDIAGLKLMLTAVGNAVRATLTQTDPPLQTTEGPQS